MMENKQIEFLEYYNKKNQESGLLKIKEIIEKYNLNYDVIISELMKEKVTKKAESNENIKVYNVYQEFKNIWISEKDFAEINRALNGRFGTTGIQMTMLAGEICVKVNMEFLKYVKENTINPKYVPQLVPLDEKDWTEEERKNLERDLNTEPNYPSMYR